jgi:serine/threonine-protein kinase
MRGEQLLDRIAGAVLDAAPVDWDAAESTADESARPFIRHLRLVASVGQLHREVMPAAAAAESEERGVVHWGHLRLIDSIGRGTFGEVFRAWDTRLDREVALKLIPAAHTVPPAGESTIIQEGRLLAKIRHPNVVTIYGAEQIGGQIGLWMEFVHGRTLEQQLQDGTTFPAADLVHVGVELCRAVTAVHSAGLLHRDIKTHNVMRADDGRIVLMDFGAGTELAEGASPADVAGTPLYLAPEVLAGGSATVRSDVYSLGVLLYRLATKSYPVKGRSMQDVRDAHARGERIDVHMLRSHVRPALAAVIERACDPEPERRYQTAEALGRDLAALRPRSTAVRIRNALAVAAVVAISVLLASEARARLSGEGRTGLASRLAALVAGASDPLDHPVIVVRPFRNTGDPADSTLADLITDGVIRRLGLVEGLQVRGLETSLRLADEKDDLASIGRRLGVNLALDGDVRFANERLHVRAALLSVTGERLWSEPFDRAVASEGDIAAMVDDLARAIVNRLRLELGPTRMQYPTDLATLRMYLQAHALRGSRGARNLKAIELYKTVIDAYPDHAPALADLAATYGDLGAQYPTVGADSLPPDEARALLWPLAQRALEIDESLAEAHAAMGFFHALDLHWEDAEKAFLKALVLEPTRSTLRSDYVLSVLVPTGRLSEAIEVLEQGLENDPGSLDLRRVLARVQLNHRAFEEALNNARLVLARDPSFPFVEQFAAWAQLFKGDRADALDWFETFSSGNDRIAGTADDLPGVKGWIHAINGRRAEAVAIAESPQFSRLPLRRAEIYGLLGDAEKTLQALEDQADLNPLRAAFYLTYPELSVLDNDPRVADFRRRRLGLQD